MNILCIIHEDFETPGVIEEWAKEKKFSFEICKPYQGENCLDKNFDFLIVMGGSQSPLEIEKDSYLKDEILLIKKAVKEDKIILGFCLGAQLIGEALGGKTQKSPEKEIGVYPVFLTEEGKCDPLLEGIPSKFEAIHWHNDMPGIVENAKILAFSEGCPRQIVRYSNKIYGFQCHLEIPLKGMERMIQACQHDLKPSRFTQTQQTLLEKNYDDINIMMCQILDRLIEICVFSQT